MNRHFLLRREVSPTPKRFYESCLLWLRSKTVSEQALYVIVSFTLTFYILIVGTGRPSDWDYVFTTFDVERQSWIKELTPPTWSYQFCGGHTRIADPQSFAFSPIFIFPLLFGSLLGVKLFVILSIGIGFYFIRKILGLSANTLGHNENSPVNIFIIDSLSLIFILSEYFLCRFYEGHFSTTLIFWFLGVIYVFLRAIQGYAVTRKHLILVVGIVFVIYSGGFYQNLFFFELPFAIAITLHIIILTLRRVYRQRAYWLAEEERAALWVVAAGGLGLVLSAFRIIPAVLYSSHFQRVHNVNYPDVGSPLNFLIYQILPHSMLINLGYGKREVYGFWEFSSFNTVPWLILVSLLLLCWNLSQKKSRRATLKAMENVSLKNKELTSKKNDLVLFFAIYVTTVASFSMGKATDFTLFQVFNGLLSGALRGATRFHIGFTFAFCFLAVWVLPYCAKNQFIILRKVVLIGLMVQIGNMWTLVTIQDARSFIPTLMHNRENGAMQKLSWQGGTQEGMYSRIYQNTGILGCYSPLPRIRILDALLFTKIRDGVVDPDDIPLIHLSDNITPQCVKGSYFTQSRIYLDSSCEGLVCLNFNEINPADPILAKVKYSNKRWCINMP